MRWQHVIWFWTNKIARTILDCCATWNPTFALVLTTVHGVENKPLVSTFVLRSQALFIGRAARPRRMMPKQTPSEAQYCLPKNWMFKGHPSFSPLLSCLHSIILSRKPSSGVWDRICADWRTFVRFNDVIWTARLASLSGELQLSEGPNSCPLQTPLFLLVQSPSFISFWGLFILLASINVEACA